MYLSGTYTLYTLYTVYAAPPPRGHPARPQPWGVRQRTEGALPRQETTRTTEQPTRRPSPITSPSNASTGDAPPPYPMAAPQERTAPPPRTGTVPTAAPTPTCLHTPSTTASGPPSSPPSETRTFAPRTRTFARNPSARPRTGLWRTPPPAAPNASPPAPWLSTPRERHGLRPTPDSTTPAVPRTAPRTSPLSTREAVATPRTHAGPHSPRRYAP